MSRIQMTDVLFDREASGGNQLFKVGRTIPGGTGLTVTIREWADPIDDLAGANATHYTAATGGSSSTSAFTADAATGAWSRWVDPGRYDVTYSGTGITTVTKRLEMVDADRTAVTMEAPINIDWPEHGGSLQSAIDSLGDGGKIWIPPGNRVWDAADCVAFARDNVHIEGPGRAGGEGIIVPAGEIGIDIGDNVSVFHNVSIKGLSLTRAVAGSEKMVRLRKIDQWRIDDSDFAAGTVNLDLSACIAGIVTHCGINSFTQHGVRMDNCDQVLVNDNTWESNEVDLVSAGDGAHIKADASNQACQWNDNVFSTAEFVLYGDGAVSPGCQFSGNVSENCHQGIVLGPTSPAAQDWLISNNNLIGTSQASAIGMLIYGTGNWIIGNRVFLFPNGLRENGTANNNEFVENTTDQNIVLVGAGSRQKWNRGAGDPLSVGRFGDLRFITAITAANANNNSLFRDSADDKLKYKDNGGTANALY